LFSFAPFDEEAGCAALIAALTAIVLTAGSAATSLPNLRTATAKRGHVVVTYTLSELAPGRILAAVRRWTAPNGRLVAANVRLNEPLRSPLIAPVKRASTKRALRPGLY
jgi:hypothetical protein